MEHREGTVRTRILGAELRHARSQAGIPAVAMAGLLGCSPDLVCRLESGKRGSSNVGRVAGYLAHCGVTGTHLNRILDLCRTTYDRSCLFAHGDRLPDQQPALIAHESAATMISEYEPLVIPPLLQTEDYARALAQTAAVSPKQRPDHLLHARRNRHKTITRYPADPPEQHYFIAELVLRSPVGGNRTMNEQLLHLTLISVRPACHIRVIPATTGPAGLLGVPFRLMEFADLRVQLPVVYLENQTTSVFLDDPSYVATYRGLLDRLDGISLDDKYSRELLAHLADEYDQ